MLTTGNCDYNLASTNVDVEKLEILTPQEQMIQVESFISSRSLGPMKYPLVFSMALIQTVSFGSPKIIKILCLVQFLRGQSRPTIFNTSKVKWCPYVPEATLEPIILLCAASIASKECVRNPRCFHSLVFFTRCPHITLLALFII